MEVTSQHCVTVPNKAKDILDTVNIERNVKHDSRAQHPVQSSVRGMLRVPRTFIFSLGKLRSIERFRTLKAKCRIGFDWIGYDYTAVTPRALLQSNANNL